MLTKPALLDDQFIDMKFITQLTGLSDMILTLHLRTAFVS